MSRVRVLYDFTAESANELTAKAGEELIVVKSELYDGWIEVKNMRGVVGIVPTTYVEFTSSTNNYDSDGDIPPPPSSATYGAPTAAYNSSAYNGSNSNSTAPSYVNSWNAPAAAPAASSGYMSTTSNNNSYMNASYQNQQNFPASKQFNTSTSGINNQWNATAPAPTSAPKARHNSDDDSSDFSDEDSKNNSTMGHNASGSSANNRHSTGISVAGGGTLGKPKAKNPLGIDVFLLHGAVKNVLDSDKFSTIIFNEHRQSVWKQLSAPFQVSILGTHSEKKFHGVKKFTTYEIQAKIFPQRVKRRYNHFDWLHKRLHDKFGLSICIPPLPDKAVTGNFEDEFIAKRRSQLEMWLNRMGSHPVISQSEVFVHFLQCDDNSSKWKSGKRKAEKEDYRGAQWYCTLTVPGESVGTTNEIRERVDKFAKASANLENSVKNVSSALEKLCVNHTSSYKKEFDNLGKRFDEFGASLRYDGLDAPNNSALSSALVTAGNTYKQIGNMYGEQAKVDIGPLIDRLALYRGIIQQMPEIVQTEKSAIQLCEEFQTRPEKLEGRSSMEVGPRREIISHVTFAEINLFNKDKVEDFTLYMRAFLQQQIAFYSEITDCLKRAYADFEKIPVSPQAANFAQQSSVRK